MRWLWVVVIILIATGIGLAIFFWPTNQTDDAVVVDDAVPTVSELTELFSPDEELEAITQEITNGYYPTGEELDPDAEWALPDLPPVLEESTIVVNEEGLEVVQGEILVGWDGTATAEQRTAAIIEAGGSVRYDDPETLTTIVYVADQSQVPQVVSNLQASAGVTGALQNYLLEEDANNFAPTDPDYPDEAKSWWLRQMNMEPAWQMTKGSPYVVVAVIDAGFELDHPDLVGAFTKTTLNFSNTPLNAKPRHGTHVSGIIAARQNNDEGLTGIAPKVRVLPIKIADLGRLPAVFRTLRQWPGVRIASMSMGWGWRKKNNALIQAGQPALTQAYMQQQSAALDAIIRPAFEGYYQGGGIFCKSAGNDYGYDSKLNGMNFDEVITVAAGDATGAVTNFSNVGSQVDVTAPGNRIWSPINGHSYDYLSGTSMATPATCATAALVRSLRPKFGPLLVKKILEKSAVEPNTNIDAWRALLRTTKRFGVTGSVFGPTGAVVAEAEVSTQPSSWSVLTNTDGDYIIPYLLRTKRIVAAAKDDARGKTAITPPALTDDEVLELVWIDLEKKDSENENENTNRANDNTNSTTNESNGNTAGSNTNTAGGGEQVLDNGVVVSAAGCAVSGYTVPPAEGDCAPGFAFSRETIACEQIECPAGVGRTYTLECKCEGEGYQAIYACDTPGYMVACIQS